METARLLADLNDAQREAVTSPHAPLRILAGAGSGKTRVLTRRIAHRAATGDADPRHVLALTFTRRAAGELRQRLRSLGLRDAVAAGTFHGIAWAQLQARWEDRGVRPPDLLTRKVGVVANLLPGERRRGGTTALDVVTELEWAAARLVEPEDYVVAARRARRDPPVDPALVAEVYRSYREHKARKRLVDFDDLLRFWHRDLVRDPEFAGVQRWRFRHLFVDEFQDVNPAQHALLTALLGDRRDLCVVGDPNQAIYAWNGADAGYLVDFDRWWPGGATVTLRDNYRSSPQVLRVANALLGSGDRVHGEVAELVPHRPDGPEATVTACPDDRTEAATVARAVRDAHRPGGRWARQAVLVRTNSQTALVEQALRQAGIPCRVRGGAALLDRPEVKEVLRDLRRREGPFDGVVTELTEAAREARRTRGDHGDAEAEVGRDDRAANLEALARLAHDYEAHGGRPSVRGLLAWLGEFARGEEHGGGDAVEVVTFHAAKGLEWAVVHLAGLEDGYVPISHARSELEKAEERRLVYVALTRAREALHCTWAQQRTFGERTVARHRSPFLDDVERARAVARTAGSTRRSPPRPRSRVDEPAPPPPRRPTAVPREVAPGDHELYRALQAWRARLAAAGRVPPAVVADDRTLVALATTRPSSPIELGRVPGLGPSKVARYGEALVALVAEHPPAVEDRGIVAGWTSRSNSASRSAPPR
jgi:DNA helicase-2/ATP-dependent DNA helicase PcrA